MREVRSVRLRDGLVGLLLALWGCAPACDGCGPVDAPVSAGAAPEAQAVVSAPRDSTLTAAVASEVTTQAQPTQPEPQDLPGPTEAPERSPPHRVFPDAPRGEAREALLRVHEALSRAEPPPVGVLASPGVLARVLPDSLVKGAVADAMGSGPSGVGAVATRVVSRKYTSGAREVFVRVIDAGQAPSFRAPVIQQLAQEGNEQQGFMHGRLVAGYPTVTGYFAQARSSRATAVVGNRYLVDVRVSGADTPHDAQDVIAAMALSQLAPPEAPSGAP